MLKKTDIRRIRVEGLHQQFDVDLTFKPGLNIIYGKNGTGKTTVLHLLANALELDFKRFSYLQFHRITIENGSGDALEITKEGSPEEPVVRINGASTSFSGGNQSLTEAEVASLREVLGGRPTYLPAFRSILERSRSEYLPNYYRAQDREDPEAGEIAQRELALLRESTRPRSAPSQWEQRQLEEAANTTAQKTVLCRQWFGRFVPVIRYPSVTEVEAALTEEWRTAHLQVSHREQRMLQETFVRVFRAIAGFEKPISADNNEGLLAIISDLLRNQESELATTESSDIYNSLRAAVRSIDTNNVVFQGVDTSLLQIYRQVLEQRIKERQVAFERSRDFEASVNKFLEKKTFTIGSRAGTARARSAVSVVGEGGHAYGITALSSGERQILTMLYSASRTKFLSGIFLIDEPELSLHIDWQRIVLRELQRQAPDSQIIACTHSPEVGADHFGEIQDFQPQLGADRQPSLFSDQDS